MTFSGKRARNEERWSEIPNDRNTSSCSGVSSMTDSKHRSDDVQIRTVKEDYNNKHNDVKLQLDGMNSLCHDVREENGTLQKNQSCTRDSVENDDSAVFPCPESRYLATKDEEENIRNMRAMNVQEIAGKLEETLNRIKTTTKTILAAVDEYTKTLETVQIDYVRCLTSQRSEASRLEAIEPDVISTADRFLQFAHEHFTGMRK